MIKTYSYPADKNIQLSKHFVMGEFVSSSDYTDGVYPSSVPIHDKLPEILEKVFEHFGCSCGIINSGYRTPSCDRSVGGSGSGPHTLGIAVDVYFYRDGEPIPSRLISCYLQDIGIKGIGLNCGGNHNGTHFDMRGYGVWDGSVWFGDETDYSSGYNDYYKYTGTTKAEVYPISGSSSQQTSNTSSSSSSQSTNKAMTTSNDMINIIKTYEGLILTAVKLTGEDYYTIGYGHYGSDVSAGHTITETQALELLRKDLKVFEDTVNRIVTVPITQRQFDALVSLSYNIGTGAIASSDSIKFLNQREIGHAAVDIPSWRIGMGGQILPGLQKRRQTELEFFVNGEDFVLNDCMNVRSGPGTNYPVKKVSQITANGKQCVVNNSASADAVFKEETEITCLEVKTVSATRVDVWMRCPSGWICARQGEDVFIK